MDRLREFSGHAMLGPLVDSLNQLTETLDEMLTIAPDTFHQGAFRSRLNGRMSAALTSFSGFRAAIEQLIDTEGLTFEPVTADTGSLNELAIAGAVDVTAISVAAYPLIASNYLLLRHGGSVGRGYGPVIVSKRPHAIEQARQAVLDGASYLGCGPTFPSGTKSFDRFPGLDFLRQVAEEIALPAFAIGGITRENLDHVLSAGISRVAVAGAVANATDAHRAAAELAAVLASA